MSDKGKCPLCGGEKNNGMTTLTVDLDDYLIVIRNVPATLCSLCGKEWLSDKVAERIELIVDDAIVRERQFEVTYYRDVA